MTQSRNHHHGALGLPLTTVCVWQVQRNISSLGDVLMKKTQELSDHIHHMDEEQECLDEREEDVDHREDTLNLRARSIDCMCKNEETRHPPVPLPHAVSLVFAEVRCNAHRVR
jgi:hypothetical protein